MNWTHFVDGYTVSGIWSRPLRRDRKEGRNVLFNDTLNTFYLQLYDVEHMVKNHSDCKTGNPAPSLDGLHFPTSKEYFIHTFIKPVVKHWLEWQTRWSDNLLHDEQRELWPTPITEKGSWLSHIFCWYSVLIFGGPCLTFFLFLSQSSTKICK